MLRTDDFFFYFNPKMGDGEFRVDWELKVLRPMVGVADMRSYLRDVRALKDTLWWSYGLESLYKLSEIKATDSDYNPSADDSTWRYEREVRREKMQFWVIIVLLIGLFGFCRVGFRVLGHAIASYRR